MYTPRALFSGLFLKICLFILSLYTEGRQVTIHCEISVQYPVMCVNSHYSVQGQIANRESKLILMTSRTSAWVFDDVITSLVLWQMMTSRCPRPETELLLIQSHQWPQHTPVISVVNAVTSPEGTRPEVTDRKSLTGSHSKVLLTRLLSVVNLFPLTQVEC